MANWSVSISNTSQTSITIHLPNLSPIVNQSILHYFGLTRDANDNIINSDLVTRNDTSLVFDWLSPYKEYHLSVFGINSNGEAYKSVEVTAWTEEGGMFQEIWSITILGILAGHFDKKTVFLFVMISFWYLSIISS